MGLMNALEKIIKEWEDSSKERAEIAHNYEKQQTLEKNQQEVVSNLSCVVCKGKDFVSFHEVAGRSFYKPLEAGDIFNMSMKVYVCKNCGYVHNFVDYTSLMNKNMSQLD